MFLQGQVRVVRVGDVVASSSCGVWGGGGAGQVWGLCAGMFWCTVVWGDVARDVGEGEGSDAIAMLSMVSVSCRGRNCR